MKIKNSLRPFLTIVCLALLLATPTFAQDYKSLYKNAKEYYAKEKYAEALDAFQGLTVYDKNNPYSEHASFYLALSAQKLGYALIAKETFTQLIKLYPNWSNIDEVKYQLACMYFKKGDYFLAMKELNSIKAATLVGEGVKAKQYYLAGIEDIETLKLLLEEFPTDSIVATRLTKLIANGGHEKEYKSLFDAVVKTFSIDISNYPKKETSQKEKRVLRFRSFSHSCYQRLSLLLLRRRTSLC